MKNKIMFPLILIFLSLGYVPLQGQGFMLQKDIYVAEDEVQDNVISFGGEIQIKGKVNESVSRANRTRQTEYESNSPLGREQGGTCQPVEQYNNVLFHGTAH